MYPRTGMKVKHAVSRVRPLLGARFGSEVPVSLSSNPCASVPKQCRHFTLAQLHGAPDLLHLRQAGLYST